MRSRSLKLAMVGVAGMTTGLQKLASATDVGSPRGQWAAVRAEQDGREAADIVGHVLLIEGDKFSIKEKGVTIYGGTLALDLSTSPGAIDFKHTDYLFKGKTWRGIYRIDGDTLTICDNAPDVQRSRPTRFETKPGSGRVMVVFKRAQQ